MKGMQYIAPTPSLINEAKKKRSIPDPEKQKIEDSKLAEVLDWALIGLLMYGLPEIWKSINGTGSGLGIFAFLALCIVLVGQSTLPDKVMMQEVQRPGVPLSEIVQSGKFIWTEQTKVVDWKPLCKPEAPLSFADITTPVGYLTVTDHAGNTISVPELQELISRARGGEDVPRGLTIRFHNALGEVIDPEDLAKVRDSAVFYARTQDGHDVVAGRWLTPERVEQDYRKLLEERITESGEELGPTDWRKYVLPVLERKKTIIGLAVLAVLGWLFWYPIMWFINWVRTSGWWMRFFP